MKHAGSEALDRLEPLLKTLRAHAALKEKSRGCFYRGGKGFLHFHEHGDAFFADVRLGEEFERFAATSKAQQAALLKKVAANLLATSLGDGKPAPSRSTSRGRIRKPS